MPNEAKNATMDNVNLNAGVTNSFVVGIVLIKMTIPIVGLAGMMYIPPLSLVEIALSTAG